MQTVLVLNIHGIGTPAVRIPDDELPYWMPRNEFVDFVEQLPQLEESCGLPVLLTFDDGNVSDLEVAAPLLRRHGLRAIFFPCAGRIGQAGYLDKEAIRTVHRQGFEIGSHGADHVAWRGLDDAALERESRWSADVLAEVIGRRVDSLALPFGSYDARALAAARRAGYSAVYNSDPGLARMDRPFRRRWTYRSDLPFDLRHMAARSRNPRHRLERAIKAFVKARR